MAIVANSFEALGAQENLNFSFASVHKLHLRKEHIKAMPIALNAISMKSLL